MQVPPTAYYEVRDDAGDLQLALAVSGPVRLDRTARFYPPFRETWFVAPNADLSKIPTTSEIKFTTKSVESSPTSITNLNAQLNTHEANLTFQFLSRSETVASDWITPPTVKSQFTIADFSVFKSGTTWLALNVDTKKNTLVDVIWFLPTPTTGTVFSNPPVLNASDVFDAKSHTDIPSTYVYFHELICGD